jgi:hypothetical protein
LLYRGEKTGVHLASEACLDLSQKKSAAEAEIGGFRYSKIFAGV